MGELARAGLLLLLTISLPQSLGLKCGISPVDLKSKETALESGFFSRINSWRNSTVGGHPWQVSLKLGEHHFCGGSWIPDDLVVTAAHCLVSFDEMQFKNLTVTVGEYNLFQKDKQEQTIPVSKIIIHPDYNRLGYMNSDIALLHLKYKVQFATAVQPVCLPPRHDKYETGVFCMTSGWRKISDSSQYADVLQEVELPILDDRTCNTVLKNMNLPPLEGTMFCAGFLDEEKDACQGDSGGPLVCRRDDGTWTPAGITSWRGGCAKGWVPLRNNQRRVSPSIFSKVFEWMDFITHNMITDGANSEHPSHNLQDCRTHGTVLFGESGKISYFHSKEGNCSHNCLCIWKIIVPEDKIILIKFTSVDIENQVRCDHDYVSLQSSKGVLISKVCGDMLPSPLLTDTNEATVTFVSDTENAGSGFELTFTAIQKNSEADSGCGSVAVLIEEGTIHSASYPDLYPSNVMCHWLIHAPEKHIIKLAFEDFNIEVNQNCTDDAIVIYGDAEEEHELAKLCGILNPIPVYSPSNMMVIHFKSDGENNFRGFKARFTFLPSDSLNKTGSTLPPKTKPVPPARAIPYDVCGIPPFSLQWHSRRIMGGEEACPHCWPWQVGLRFLGDHQCEGVIINPFWILTAAHCVHLKNNPFYWTIIAGDHDRTLKESTEQVRRAKFIVGHEDFDMLNYDSDIALIQLNSPLEYNAVVRPVCLPERMEPLLSSEICAVTGWGSISEDGGPASCLQQMQVPVLEREVCESTCCPAHPGGITAKMICAGFASSGGKYFCQGYSGGPLVCRHEKGPFVLYGIISWGASCAQPRKPAVFARVRIFLDWIQSKIKDTSPASLQVNNGSKTLKKQLPPSIPSTESASGSVCYSNVKLEEPRGFFSTPRYPLDYRGKLECSWILRVSPSSMAKFTVEYLSLPESYMCQDSVLMIYEENQSERRMSGKLCGRRLYPMIFMSSGPFVRVIFHSLLQGAFGIRCIVFRVQGTKGSKITTLPQSSNQKHVVTCENVTLTKPEGIIQIPRYLHGSTVSCQWRLVAPLNHIIRLDIINFHVKSTRLACKGHLWIYEGSGPGRKLIGNLCKGDSSSLKSHGPIMTLILMRNVSLAMEDLSLRYSFHIADSMREKIKVNDKGCPVLNLIPVGYAEITSPNYPNIYPSLLKCTWTFYSKSGNKVKAVIKDFITEESWNCEWDYFNIYDGPDHQSRLLAHLCGLKREFVLTSSGAYLTLHFKTDESVGERGFKFILEDMIQKQSQESKIRTQLPISGKKVDALKFFSNIEVTSDTVTDNLVIGKSYLSKNIASSDLIQVKAVYTHPGFSQFPPNDDLSLLHLKKPIELGEFISPICLPGKEDKVDLFAKCMTAGWGTTEPHREYIHHLFQGGETSKIIQQAKVPLISIASCRSYWGLDIKNTNICGGAAGSSSCMGDSGGPLQCAEDGQYKLIGIVSWGSSNCHPTAPSVFTRISAYRDWITSVTGGEA